MEDNLQVATSISPISGISSTLDLLWSDCVYAQSWEAFVLLF